MFFYILRPFCPINYEIHYFFCVVSNIYVIWIKSVNMLVYVPNPNLAEYPIAYQK